MEKKEKRYYENGNIAKSNIKSFSTLPHSHIKSIREDFNDMFAAEHNARLSVGDRSLVFVLTYNDEHILTKFGRNLLNAADLKRFSKSSAFAKFLLRGYGVVFDFVSIGEYGNGGESHNFIGERGKGNNPHYHCVGWFHQVQEPNNAIIFNGLKKRGLLSLQNLSHYDQLCALVRWCWQGCLEDDKIKYALDKEKRSLGLGYVCLDGPIKTCGASSYISKYMGKNVHGLYQTLIESKFIESWRPLFIQKLNKLRCKVFIPLSDDDVLKLWYFHAKNTDCANYELFRYLPIECTNLPPCGYLSFHELFEYFDYVFIDNAEEFQQEFNTTYSPKMRHFAGFGYALIHHANMDDGTYYITRPKGTVNRVLPPSLLRHFFYNYKVCVNSVGEKIVKYELNKYGLCLVHNRLKKSLNNSRLLIKLDGSELLKKYSDDVTRLFHCVLPYQTHFPVFYRHLIKDDDTAIQFNVSCHSVECPINLVPCKRVLYDVLDDVRKLEPDLYKAYKEFLKLREQHLLYRDSKDEEFLEKCQEIYKFSY